MLLPISKVKGLTSEQSEAMVRLSRLPAFSDLVDKVEADEVNTDIQPKIVYFDTEIRKISILN